MKNIPHLLVSLCKLSLQTAGNAVSKKQRDKSYRNINLSHTHQQFTFGHLDKLITLSVTQESNTDDNAYLRLKRWSELLVELNDYS